MPFEGIVTSEALESTIKLILKGNEGIRQSLTSDRKFKLFFLISEVRRLQDWIDY